MSQKELLVKAQLKLDKLLSQKNVVCERIKEQQKVVDNLLYQVDKEELEETKMFAETLQNKGIDLKELVDAVENNTLDLFAEKVILTEDPMQEGDSNEVNHS